MRSFAVSADLETPDQNRKAVENVVGRFRCVDVDLIFDAAYGDPRILLDDLTTCFDLGVDQVPSFRSCDPVLCGDVALLVGDGG